MKKMKKVVASLLATSMVLGMSMTTLAAEGDTANINVSNAEGATLGYVYAIKPDTSKEAATGWSFVTDDIADDFTSAFGVTDEQTAIAMLIKAGNPATNEYTPAIIKNTGAASATQIQQALDNVINGENATAMSNGQEVGEAGLYVIKATGTGYTYKAMSAYVGFGPVDGNYPVLDDADLEAKKIPTNITKEYSEDGDEDKAVVIGQEVTYTLETSFPYFNQNATNKVFKISDEIEGAAYKDLDTTATVTIGGGDPVAAEFEQDGDTFTVDLSSYIDNENSNAGKEVVVTYKAIVDEVQVVNGATSHVGGVDYDSNEIELFTGKITLTKTNEDGSVKLADAGFEVKKGEEVLTFVQKDANVKVYTYDPAGTITEVFTDANGEVVVEGLDIGTYSFVEKTAPEGYSVNEQASTATLEVGENGATAIFTASTSMADTKLIALPQTGGMGTALFTFGGCGIMIAAAFLLIANKRREEE